MESRVAALAVFPRENLIPLRHIAGQTNNIAQWTEFDRGGHFPRWKNQISWSRT